MTFVKKICKVCKINKVLEEFPKRGNYRLKTCDSCYKEQQTELFRKRYAEDPEFKRYQIEKVRRSSWKSNYGVTPEEVYTALDEQGRKCANLNCLTEISLDPFEPISKRANIDHCHKTGKFRALLCNSCNTFLGRIEKNPGNIAGLVDYLNRFNFNQ